MEKGHVGPSLVGGLSGKTLAPRVAWNLFFPTCQVRVVRFCQLTSAFRRLPPPPDLNHDQPRPVFPAGPQPDLNREDPRQVFPAGPQPRPSTPSVPCRTPTARIHAKCSLPDLNRRRECQKICQIECQIERQIECQIECQRRMPDKNAR